MGRVRGRAAAIYIEPDASLLGWLLASQLISANASRLTTVTHCVAPHNVTPRLRP